MSVPMNKVDPLLPRYWMADSVQRWRPWEGPEVPDTVLETATDAELARLLNLAGWPVSPPRSHVCARGTGFSCPVCGERT